MGTYEPRIWQSKLNSPWMRSREISEYRVYIPDRMIDFPNSFSHELSDRLNDTALFIGKVDAEGKAVSDDIDYFLSRSESLASSAIEGHRISPSRLAEVEILGSSNADEQAVLNNVDTMRIALDEVAHADIITTEHIIELQHALLPDMPRGYRTMQNWIGGNSYSPLHAIHVPPPPELVASCMDNLINFMNTVHGNPIANAALAHAQYEAIHPFADGNGRTGRALIQVMLRRSALSENVVLPVSSILLRDTRGYFTGLGCVRIDGTPNAAVIEDWLDRFANVAESAAERTLSLIDQSTKVKQRWWQRVRSYRDDHGMKALRSDSVTSRIIDSLLRQPCLTAESAAQRFNVSHTAAAAALNGLSDAGVLVMDRDHRSRSNYYVAVEATNMIDQIQRQSGTYSIDEPKLILPPPKEAREPARPGTCGKFMPIAKTTCRRRPMHHGQCRS